MTAFITRDLSETSDFRHRLEAAGWEAQGMSLVALSPLPFGEVPAADWVFFSSGNAVRFFFGQLRSGNTGNLLPPTLQHAKWAALGPATAKVLAEYVDKVDFIGTGEPEETARRMRGPSCPSPGPSPVGRGGGEDTVEGTVDYSREGTIEDIADSAREDAVGSRKDGILNPSAEEPQKHATEEPAEYSTVSSREESAEHSTVSSRPPLPTGEGPGEGLEGLLLFPAARNSLQSVMSFLGADFQCIPFPVYDNRPVSDPPHVAADVLVFTSPMNAQAYFSKHVLGVKQRVVSIGQTTAGALRELGIAAVEVAETPDERGLAEAVLRLRW